MRKTDIGIIGSADGPTRIVVSSRALEWYEIAAIVIVAAVIAAIIIRAITKRQHRQ